MSNTIPVHSVEYGVDEENVATFKALEAAREAGTLAGSRELAPEGATVPTVAMLEMAFVEKTSDELAKMSKKDVLEYITEFAKNAEAISNAKAEHAAKLAEVAAIHGIPRGKIGEPILAMLENRPDHPGRGKPYPLLDEEGAPRVTQQDRRRNGKTIPKGTVITRMDN